MLWRASHVTGFGLQSLHVPGLFCGLEKTHQIGANPDKPDFVNFRGRTEEG